MRFGDHRLAHIILGEPISVALGEEVDFLMGARKAVMDILRPNASLVPDDLVSQPPAILLERQCDLCAEQDQVFGFAVRHSLPFALHHVPALTCMYSVGSSP